ncbi:bifunctional 5,10-methylenetetrahydrofolate dehydrogenase/5,10-methenyltetrahydrofolate cyclohydrolase [Candidatus Gottesmanbacteria bacterium]|nr:bifunctional 5,10-methylenetetrahydrofolate dehydrogenase/5,10-methenyltetrahydrofolate cyclohydrolase [Candidatus Gottesmanbacteria bacterium]
MKFDGRALAHTLYEKLKRTVDDSFARTNIRPNVDVFLVGDNPSSISFIKQKRIAAEKIGATLTLHQSSDISFKDFEKEIQKSNINHDVHGIVIQRPLPEKRNDLTPLLQTIAVEKDVDGFLPHSPFEVPVAEGVLEILKEISLTCHVPSVKDFLKNKTIVVIGRGVTAGTPITRIIAKHGVITPIVIHSQTENPKSIMISADILISCVGQTHTVTKDSVKNGVILIGVGLSRNEEGTYSGDYDEKEIEERASWYTPTPGGVGPVNVACLMKNLVISYTQSIGGTV